MIKRHWRAFLKDPWQAKYVWMILIINFFGSVYGYYWYAGQLAATDKKLWLFVPDSPLATTMLAVVLALSLTGFRKSLFTVLACTACIKYGLWAVIVITDSWMRGSRIMPEEMMLWISHLGMAAQGLVYLWQEAGARIKRGDAPFAGEVIVCTAAWMAVNDFLDYYLDIHPYLYMENQETMAAAAVVLLSVLILLSLILINRAGPARIQRQ